MAGPEIYLPGGKRATEEDFGRKTLKRLMICIPTAPRGHVATEQHIWLQDIQVHSICNELGLVLSEQSDPANTLAIRQAVKLFARAYTDEMTHLHQIDPRKLKYPDAPALPPNWSATILPVQGRPLPVNRNNMCRRFLWSWQHEEKAWAETDFDVLLMLDDDIVPGMKDLNFMLEAMDVGDDKGNDVDVLSALYPMERHDGPAPLLYVNNEDWSRGDFDTETLVRKKKDLHYCPRGSTGAGALMIKRHVLDHFWEQSVVWFKDRINDLSMEYAEIQAILNMDCHAEKKVKTFERFQAALEAGEHRIGAEKEGTRPFGEWHRGEDIYFFKKIDEFKFRFYCDTRLFWQHTKPVELKHYFFMRETTHKLAFLEGQKAADVGRKGAAGYTKHGKVMAKQKDDEEFNFQEQLDEARKLARKLPRE